VAASSRRARTLTAAALGLTVACAGCGGDENTLQPHSHAEHSIALLWWVMFGVACFGLALIGALLALGWFRRNRAAVTGAAAERRGTALVIGLGVVFPVAVVTALFVWSDIFVIRSTAAPPPASTAMTIEVTGHQWWWEVRYPGTAAVTANEIHIPTHTRVNVVGRSDDVIHSLWVPELNRKIDLIPGRTNRVLLEADRPGIYRGQCSEFCGLQHAHMTVEVVAQPQPAFHAWLANMAKPATTPATGSAQAGRATFLGSSCASCHMVRGTSAHGDVGPDLTHLATRATLAAVTIPNDAAHLRAWLEDPQRIKPGSKMPAVPLTGTQLDDLTAYLEGLH
jgi:cytochrome c oxidase subunit II